MKKFLWLIFIIPLFILAACGGESATDTNNSDNTNEEETAADNQSAEGTITYESENGPIEVPSDPQRVIALSGFAGNVLALDVPLIGAESFSMQNPLYDLEGVQEVSDENLEKIIELDPDLIIGLTTIKNYDQLSEIAPTVTFTYGEYDYLDQHIEIGKLLNKEEEATKWVEDFRARAQQAGEEIKVEIGEDATVTVIENADKELYVFGDNWARGTEILYQEMGLAMPDKVKEDALEAGYYTLSLEVLPDYVGDYLVISKTEETETSFMETETYKNIPAVQNDQVMVADAREFYFTDPITLDNQLEFFLDNFLEK
ncbi:iron complex transport system substrate-binding protein [Gracilibacillus ureilyticus]|uniref:Iron complex transport system substrate-binding protein n=1 Tax=Gracilibacillus ureilyticus TaxID=531814 RepID=A0A1H9Q687_9BACI|nr:iron-hydroxamate ABC transporter substrate-binding protein [Gracilibacillus ureilyticus]SER55932.1 iron complex transport system substrate-binding protein [Gracilibacillus ureilyticus]